MRTFMPLKCGEFSTSSKALAAISKSSFGNFRMESPTNSGYDDFLWDLHLLSAFWETGVAEVVVLVFGSLIVCCCLLDVTV